MKKKNYLSLEEIAALIERVEARSLKATSRPSKP